MKINLVNHKDQICPVYRIRNIICKRWEVPKEIKVPTAFYGFFDVYSVNKTGGMAVSLYVLTSSSLVMLSKSWSA